MDTLFRYPLRSRKHLPCFHKAMVARVEVWENVESCGNVSCCPQTFISVTRALRKIAKKVFYFSYKINTQKNFRVSTGLWLTAFNQSAFVYYPVYFIKE